MPPLVLNAAFEFEIKAAMHLNENLWMNTQVQRNVSGPIAQLPWVTTYESLAQFEERQQKMQADEVYKSLLFEPRVSSLCTIGFGNLIMHRKPVVPYYRFVRLT